MSSFLVAEKGPLAGLIIRLEENDEWIIGRDPDVSYQVIEDPMVSRKHVLIRLTDQGHVIENLSATNPASVNGTSIEGSVLLQEDDTVQIGNIFLRFTEQDPAMHLGSTHNETTSVETPTLFEEEQPLDRLSLTGDIDAKWLVKVISGPNTGAEFGVHPNSTYIIGKDSDSCDIVFQDLSVSRQHARLSTDELGGIFIEDLNSCNGVLVNDIETKGKQGLISQDRIVLGTTTILIIDREQTSETIVSPLPFTNASYPEFVTNENVESKTKLPETSLPKNWKEMFIPTRHIVVGAVFTLFIALGVCGVFALFHSQTITIEKSDESGMINTKMRQFPGIEFSFNPSNRKLFLLGHVLKEIDQQELLYNIKSLPFMVSIENNVIIDELVWESFNDMLHKNPNWYGVTVIAITPGSFVLRGYLESTEESTKLVEYVNTHFPYLDHLENQVAVENILATEIQSILLVQGLVNVTFQLNNGEVILSGRVNQKATSQFEYATTSMKKITGVRLIKNFVVITTESTERINISDKYQITGSSKVGNVNQYIVINGKILADGDNFQGMQITDIESNAVLLEKDGIKYQINYNHQ